MDTPRELERGTLLASSKRAVFSGHYRWRCSARCDLQLSNQFPRWHDSRYCAAQPLDLFSCSDVVAAVLSRCDSPAFNCLSRTISGAHSGFTKVWRSFSTRCRAHVYRPLCVPGFLFLPRRYHTESLCKISAIFSFASSATQWKLVVVPIPMS